MVIDIQGRWGCEGSSEFEEGTQPRCNILSPKDDPTACKATDDLDPDLDPVEVTSECPWHYMANINKYRYEFIYVVLQLRLIFE